MAKDKLLRLWDVIGDSKKGQPALIPVSKSTWWKGVKEGRFPQPVRLSRVTCWRESEILAIVHGTQEGGDRNKE